MCGPHYSEARRATPEVKAYMREWWLKNNYGISAEIYEKMLKAQHGVCAICGEPERLIRQGKVMPLAVDHDHTTGEVRGLLCAKCNRAIGILTDEGVLVAADYIRGGAHGSRGS